MPLCVSFFTRQIDQEILGNHAFYCQLHGYAHRLVEAAHLATPEQTLSYKYGQILHHLRQLPDGDWLFFIDDDSVIFRPVAIDALMRGRDVLVVDGPPEGGVSGKAMTNMMVLRNTPAVRATIHELMADAGRMIARLQPWVDERARFAAVGVLPVNAVLADTHVHVSWRIVNWHDASAFVVCLAPVFVRHADEPPKALQLHDMNLQRLLARLVTRALKGGGPALEPARYPALSHEPMSCHHPGGRIAFVMLYSANVAAYGRVAEHNLKRYAERHGHTCYVYRELPDDLAAAGMGASWAKPWLLRRHFEQHEWVIWIDADALFINQSQPIESLLHGRDLLLAKDIGNWHVNSGVLGFRRTARNADVLAAICARIEQVDDKSGVYSSQGDQYHINAVLSDMGLLGEANVLDNVSINTPPHFATPQSLLVHFINLGEPYRSAYMADWDARSKALG